MHFVLLVLGQHFGDHSVDADGVGDGLGRPGIVAGDHRDGQAEIVKLLNGVDSGRFQCVGDCDDAAHLAVPTGEHGGPTLVLEFHGLGIEPAREIE